MDIWVHLTPFGDIAYGILSDIYGTARQIGIIKIKGSIGDLSFYESGGMQLVRKKTGATEGEGIVDIPAFIPAQRIRLYETSTHAQLMVALIEFGAVVPEQIKPIVWRSDYQALSNVRPISDMNFSFGWVPKSGNALIVLVGVYYFEQIAGSYFPVAKGKYNAVLFDKVY